jgi:hypothetical protein
MKTARLTPPIGVTFGLGFLTALASGQTVSRIKVQPDKAPDSSSLKSIVESVTRDCKTNDEKAIAIYNYCLLTNYHLAYPTEPGGVPSLKVINCYGWSLCGGLHTLESALWMEAGFEHRYVGWNGHTTVEAKYDGRWHYLDIFLKFYAWEPDGKGGRTIASEDDLNNRSDELIRDGFVLDKGRNCVYAKDNQFIMNGEHANWRAPAFLSCGDTIKDVIAGLKTHHNDGPEAGWAGINHATGSYSTDVNLAPGLSLTNTWDPSATQNDWFWAASTKAPAHTCGGHKDTRNDPSYGLILEPYVNSEPARSYANGTLSFNPDFTNDAFLTSFEKTDNVKYAGGALVPAETGKPASVTLKLASPYLISGHSSGMAEGADKIEVSLDSGKSFQPIDFSSLGTLAKGKLDALVKVTFSHPLKSLKLAVDVQNNPGALPYLSPGKNIVAVSALDPKSLGNNKLVVTYAYRLGSRAKSFDQLCDEGKEIAKQHNAHWSNTITYAQKTFTAKDLPATFEIDCPTPKGEYPVYPRMIMVRREIIAANSSPLPLPDGAVPATPASSDELATLPNPFLIGSEPPVPVKVRAVKTARIPLEYLQFCDEKGQLSDKGTLGWPKVATERGKVIAAAVEYTGQLQGLPAPKDLAAARLVFPVVLGHNKASEKVGAVFLPSPPEKGKPLSFKDLDNIAGFAIIPPQPSDTPTYNPPKPVTMDVTRSLKSIAAGESHFNGIALRIIPDRSTDDGWTVRCQVSPTTPAYLEIDTYADTAPR